MWTNCNHRLLYHFKMSTQLAFLTSCWRITPVSTWRVTSWYGRGVDGVHCCDIVSYRLPSADLREDISTELSIGRGYSRWILRGTIITGLKLYAAHSAKLARNGMPGECTFYVSAFRSKHGPQTKTSHKTQAMRLCSLFRIKITNEKMMLFTRVP